LLPHQVTNMLQLLSRNRGTGHPLRRAGRAVGARTTRQRPSERTVRARGEPFPGLGPRTLSSGGAAQASVLSETRGSNVTVPAQVSERGVARNSGRAGAGRRFRRKTCKGVILGPLFAPRCRRAACGAGSQESAAALDPPGAIMCAVPSRAVVLEAGPGAPRRVTAVRWKPCVLPR